VAGSKKTETMITLQVMVFWVVTPWRWRWHGPPKRRYPTHNTTRHHNLQDLDLKHHRRESLKTRINVDASYHFWALFIISF